MSTILSFNSSDFANNPAYPHASLYDVNTPVRKTRLGYQGPEGSKVWMLAIPVVYHNMSAGAITPIPGASAACHLPLRDMEPASKKAKVGKWGLRVKPNAVDGYFQYGTGASKGQRIHSAVWFDANPTVPKIASWHISHLCHNWWCCNPAHATYEPDWINIMRKHCPFVPGLVACTCASLEHTSIDWQIPHCLFMNAETRARVGVATEDCVYLNWSIRAGLGPSGLMNTYAGRGELWEAIRDLIAGR